MIYFARLKTGLIKIGYTDHLERRVRELRIECESTMDVLATEPGDRWRESCLHRRFGSLRCPRWTELFRPGLDLAAHITDLRAAIAAEISRDAESSCARVKAIAE